MNNNHNVSLIIAVALGAAVAAGGCAAAPPPPPPPPPVVVAPPPPPVVVAIPAKADLDLMGAQLNIKTDIEFDTAKWTLRDSANTKTTLATVLTILQAAPQITKLRIEGHTDSDGNAADNQALSENRAKAVKEWLMSKGIDGARLSHTGCAARDPLVPNNSAENKQRNRRTEFDIEGINGAQPPGYTAACAPNTSRH